MTAIAGIVICLGVVCYAASAGAEPPDLTQAQIPGSELPVGARSAAPAPVDPAGTHSRLESPTPIPRAGRSDAVATHAVHGDDRCDPTRLATEPAKVRELCASTLESRSGELPTSAQTTSLQNSRPVVTTDADKVVEAVDRGAPIPTPKPAMDP